ncbi:cytochrome oxidase subunit III [bacterium]|nr:cytochrome oxidase subunit III [bacterium]
MSVLITHKGETNFKIDPTQFTIWIFLVSVVMLFAAFTSGYIVRKAQGDWVNFELPPIFMYSCLTVVLSSATMVAAQVAQKRAHKGQMQLALFASLLIGLAFIYMQFVGWNELMDMGIYFVGNPSGSFLFVISGLHAVHFASGILAILVSLLRSFLLDKNEIQSQKIGAVAIYWHFVGALWIYLYLFLSNA